ncbi:uncharacterized protein SPPG_02668 [Spizellomyces punctatus DAOM BR117]|uniref:Dynein regulatory complex protein 12 n=1 Tax=Spizellomyces punctatus (strain DAOM BR117) TaxID=645134 RepID=A0A0L0HMZ6_SPIPD|nr:uncharacterized protein SPPG_02668 [Spizellomyces punctatus DAOM BR117]KND02179.1 hypothetical protein SPPG_02668 [Spizellomyces punctatus DAOM BR117]|eukprot:XP_016610218.1 hypothetical protein SPPG_02668 [Spizellomyces punctatus DAOM BR117]
MPPKKKPGTAGVKKKTKEKGSSDKQQESFDVTEKLVKANVEIDALVRELALQTDLNSRLKMQMDQQKARIAHLEDQLEKKSKDRLDLTSDMGRQYKSMQAEMSSRIVTLESQVADLNTKLTAAQTALQDAARDHERVLAAKETAIEDQQVKMSYMSAEFESMLNETLAKMAKKLESVSQRWKESDNIHLSDVNQRRLADFHLTRLTLGKTDG